MALVSLIIPNYNNAQYLSQALESAVQQTLTDIEIIVIDDCSTDDSIKIISEYAARDPRIKIIEMPKNGGVGAARNAGIDAATGEFIMFLDSDDCLYATAAEALVGIARANGASMVVGNYSYVGDDFVWNKSIATGATGGYGFVSSNDSRKLIVSVDFGVMPVTCWGKLYRRDTLGDMRFATDIYPNEDVDFMLRVYHRFNGKLVMNTNAIIMFYRRSETSVIMQGLSDKFVLGWRSAILSVNNYLIEQSKKLKPAPGEKASPELIALVDYRKFVGRYIFVMLQSIILVNKHSKVLQDTIRDLFMAGIFDQVSIPGRATFGLKLYVSGLRSLAKKFMIFDLPINKLF